MKKIIGLIALFLCLSFMVQAQDTTLVKKAVPFSELPLDDKVNARVRPITDWVSGWVFYSIKFKDMINYGMDQATKEKYGGSPIEFIPDRSTNVSSTNFSITPKNANTYALSYPFKNAAGDEYKVTNTFPFGKKVKVGDYGFTVNNTKGVSSGTYSAASAAMNVPIVLLVLLGGALFFTLYFAFVNVRKFGLAIDVVRGKYYWPEKSSNPDLITKEGDIPDTIRQEGVAGEVSPFQALTAALSATVGLGNIAGVAIAIATGGPGATFWMILAGLLGMSSKFAECTLGVKYREIGEDGTVYGGPMYYLSKGFAEKGMGGLGKAMAIFFAIMCVGGSFGGGNMFQANQAAAQFMGVLGINSGYAGAAFGLVMAILVGIVIIGGIKRIGNVTEKIVPFMAVIYVGAAVLILLLNFTSIPKAFGLIFQGAFAPTAIAGGFIGVLIQGFQRAAFSNEAGVGSAAIAHSAVKTNDPASEGIVALLEPFIDTVVICTMTALVIVITGNYINPDGLSGVDLTSKAFNSAIPGFSYVLTLAVVLFAFSTMLSWSYYGLQAWKYLFGKSSVVDLTYKILFCIFVVIGAAASLGAVTDFSDAMIFAMVFPNMIGVVLLAPKVKEELNKYLAKIESGEIPRKD